MKPAGITTTISSTPGAASNAATQCSTSVRPASSRSCFGVLPPSLTPVPPASTTATVRMTGHYPATCGLPRSAPAGGADPPDLARALAPASILVRSVIDQLQIVTVLAYGGSDRLRTEALSDRPARGCG